MGWFFGFKLHLIYNERGKILNFMITQGDVDDRKPLEYKTFIDLYMVSYLVTRATSVRVSFKGFSLTDTAYYQIEK